MGPPSENRVASSRRLIDTLIVHPDKLHKPYVSPFRAPYRLTLTISSRNSMIAQRTTRSNDSLNHSPIAVSRSSRSLHGDSTCGVESLAEGPTPVTVTRTALKKRQRESHVSDENPASLLVKRARLQTPALQGKECSSTHSQDDTQMPGPLPNGKAKLSFDRPAEPRRTMTTLRGSRRVPYNQEAVDAPLYTIGFPRLTTTTTHLLDEACAHLIKTDPMLQPLIEKHYCRVFSREGLAEECDPFRSLCSSIMAQQVSGAAASSIKRKFVEIFNGLLFEEKVEEAKFFPTPTQVAASDVTFLRQAGLSGRKAEYIKGLAQKFASGELSAAMLINASDEEVLEKLTAVRGLGKWSVEMFALFGLKRMDIFSTGDLGVQYDRSLTGCS